MQTTAGLWIDHRKAVIVMVSAESTRTTEIDSEVERQPGRLDGVRSTTPYESQLVPTDGSRDRKFTAHLNRYYDAVMEVLREAESILIFGPGEAKGELKKRLEREKLGGHIIATETADQMTDRQITAKVRDFYQMWGGPA